VRTVPYVIVIRHKSQGQPTPQDQLTYYLDKINHPAFNPN